MLDPGRPLHIRPCRFFERGDTVLAVDPAGPHWLGTDRRGARILQRVDGRRTLEEIAALYAREFRLDAAAARQEVDAMLAAAARRGFVAHAPDRGRGGATQQPFNGSHYAGRGEVLVPRLKELWLHTNNHCNLSCAHCLVESGPGAGRGLPTEVLLEILRRAKAMGATRFYFTGGEPLLRGDFPDIARAALSGGHRLVVLTNGILLKGPLLESLREADASARRDGGGLHLQISLDGPTPEVNDAIRGSGSFEKTVAGIRNAVAAGFEVSMSTVVCGPNAGGVPDITRLAGRLGVKRHHLLWLHERGRAAPKNGWPVPVERLIEIFDACKEAGAEAGVAIDNWEALRARLGVPAGTRFDLSSSAVESLCVGWDGMLYPSPALAGVPELAIGPWQDLERFAESPVAGMFREASVARKEVCRECDVRFLCGGGDTDNSYLHYRETGGEGTLLGAEPYCNGPDGLYSHLVFETMADLSRENRPRPETGFKLPVAHFAMGDSGLRCGDEPNGEEAHALHSNCALQYELDRYRSVVRRFYGQAAELPRPELCCPMDYAAEDLAHIPKEVLERAYGCGSPVSLANLRPGEVMADLGSGAGIDVFIAAKLVGPRGRAIGVDMTEEMLSRAREAAKRVSGNLGYDAVEFRKGFLEEVPVDNGGADLVTSNCVINLSPDKRKVFREMWRVLKDGGRFVVSDIVAAEPVPESIRVNPRLWGECIAGALTEEEFLAGLEETGFYGLTLLKKSFYREVEGQRFFSVTARGFKRSRSAECVYAGHRAVYLGPLKEAVDDEGHRFPRGVPVEVCSATLERLQAEPYSNHFAILSPEGGEEPQRSCGIVEPGKDAEVKVCGPTEDGKPCC